MYMFSTLHGVALLTEHRQAGSGHEAMIKQLAKAGWRTLSVPAAVTEKGGTSGGVIICHRHHLHVSRYGFGEAGLLQELNGDRWQLGQLRLRHTSVTTGAAYLHTGVGPHGLNLSLLQELGMAISCARRPFILGADWNMTPGELESTGFLAMLHAKVVVMPGVVQTCTSGGGRLLDYIA